MARQTFFAESMDQPMDSLPAVNPFFSNITATPSTTPVNKGFYTFWESIENSPQRGPITSQGLLYHAGHHRTTKNP
jgi:hypothetical protein